MKKISLMIGVVVLVLGLSVSAYAIERHVALVSSAESLDLIRAGFDWDGKTPLSTEEQTDRLNANVEVFRTEKRQRNVSGLFGAMLVGGGAAATTFGFLKRKV